MAFAPGELVRRHAWWPPWNDDVHGMHVTWVMDELMVVVATGTRYTLVVAEGRMGVH